MTGDKHAGDHLRDGQMHEVAGRVAAAAECYAAAVERAAQDDRPSMLSEALRRRGVLYHLQGDAVRADHLCCRAYDVALVANLPELAAEAMNALAGFALERGRLAEARQLYETALGLATDGPALVGKIEQNLGVESNIRGDWEAARRHYQRALDAYERTNDLRGCAIAYHNLGRIHADRREWEESTQRYHAARQLARAAGDVHHQGMALLGHAEACLALRQYTDAEERASEALAIFCRIDAERDRAGAHRLLGAIARDQDQIDTAEFHFTIALEIARRCDCPLEQADDRREMARFLSRQGKHSQALTFLQEARALYAGLDAAHHLAEIDGEIHELGAMVA